MGKKKSFSVCVQILSPILLVVGSTLISGCVVTLHTSARAGNTWELKQYFAWGANPNAKTLRMPLQLLPVHSGVQIGIKQVVV